MHRRRRRGHRSLSALIRRAELATARGYSYLAYPKCLSSSESPNGVSAVSRIVVGGKFASGESGSMFPNAVEGARSVSPPPAEACGESQAISAGENCNAIEASILDTRLSILHVNIRGWLSHEAELHANLVDLSCPSFVALTETWLDKSIPNISLEGYSLVARLDRRDGRRAGGIALFAVHSLAQSVVLVETSDDHERFWVIVHTDHGPLLLSSSVQCHESCTSVTTVWFHQQMPYHMQDT